MTGDDEDDRIQLGSDYAANLSQHVSECVRRCIQIRLDFDSTGVRHSVSRPRRSEENWKVGGLI